MKIPQHIKQWLPSLASAHRICKVIKWGSLLAAVSLICFMVSLEYLAQYRFRSSILSHEHLAALTSGMAIFVGLFCCGWFIAEALPAGLESPATAKQTAQLSQNQRVQQTLIWYKRASFRGQYLGLLLAATGVVLNYDAALSLFMLIVLLALVIRYFKDPQRKPANRFFREQASKERACASISIQSLFMFAMTLTFSCAHIAQNGIAQFYSHALFKGMTFFAVIGFLSHFYIVGYLMRHDQKMSYR